MTVVVEESLGSVANIIMGLSPKGDTYNNEGIGTPLLNGPTEFGDTNPDCSLFTTDSKRECKKGALIFCVRASTGKMNWADRVYSLGRGVCSISGETQLDTKFIRYCLDFKLDALLKNAGGGTFSNLRKDDLRDFKIPYPPYRSKIASILSAYDDLIENNLKRIKILEEMAQMIYREWFVNFRFPGHEKVKMVKSELRMIPEGWEVMRIGDFGEIITGKTPSKEKPEYYNDDYMPFIKTPDMHGNMFVLEVGEYLSKGGADSQNSKTLPENSICVSCIGTVGIVSITSCPSQTNQQINSIVLKNESTREFLYFALLDLKETIQKYGATGATMANLNKGKFESLDLSCPNVTLLNAFHERVEDIFNNIRTLLRKNINLRKTRDLLLPKLISGEIDVEGLDIKTEVIQ